MTFWFAVAAVVCGPAASQGPELKLNVPLERELASGQTHEYQVALQAGEFIQVRAEQKGIDAVLSIHSADGIQLAEMDSPNGREGFETLSFVAANAGTYVIKIRYLEEEGNSRPGAYSITLTAKRPPTDLDRRRIPAEQQLLAATQINVGTVDDIQPKIEKYQALVGVWKDLGDSYVLGLIQQAITRLKEIKAETEASAKQAMEGATGLKLHESLERELASNQAHFYRVTLGAGQFMQVRIEQKGINVGVYIFSAGGTQLAEMDSPSGKEGLETLSLIADDAGVYLVRISPFRAVTPESGKYNITLTEQHPPTARDRKRIETERQFVAANRISARKAEGLHALIEQYEKLLPVWRELKDEYMVDLTVKVLSTARSREIVAGREEAKKERREGADERRKIRERAVANFPKLVVPLGHNDSVNSVAISPDRKTLASGSDDATVKLWDMATGQEIRTFTGHSNWVKSVAFSPDGKLVASMEWIKNNGIKIWDVVTGKQLRTLDHSGMGNSIIFSPDGKLLASGGDDNTIKIWDVATGEVRKTLIGHSKFVNSIVFIADGRLLVSGSDDNTIKLWDVGTGKEARTFTGHTKGVWSISLSPNGKVLASGSEDQTIKLWDVETGQVIRTLPGYTDFIQSVSFSPDGKILATGGDDKTIKLWDVESGKESKALKGHASYISSIVFSGDGKLIVSGSWDKTSKLWDVATGKEVRTFTTYASHVNSVSFDRDRKTLVVSNDDDTIRLWDITKAEATRTISSHAKIPEAILSPDGTILATRSVDRIIKLWNVSTGQELRALKGQPSRFTKIAFSPDGKLLVSGDGNDVKLWDTATGAEVKTLTGHSAPVLAVTFSPDGKVLASSGFDYTIKLWDWQAGKEIKTLAENYENVSMLTFGPDSKVLASGSRTTGLYSSADVVFRLWDVASGQEIEYTEPPEWIGRVASQILLTPGGVLIRGDRDGNKLILRNARTEDDIATLIMLGESDWAVVDREGRWDASEGAQKLMYYALETNESYEIIDFSQLKERYYEPNLLPKLLGYNKERLRDVAQFKDILLPPAVEAAEPTDAKTTIRQVEIRNRNGGIGRVQVFVNGREYIEDARDEKLKANPDLKEYVLRFDLKDASVIPGQKPVVKVIAWNYDEKAKERYKGYISSRGTDIDYLPPEEKIEPPTLYAIIGGVSDYKGNSLDLGFASKDAEDIYKAIQVGGKNLFGVERMKLKLLNTGGNKGAILPTKENFRQTFAEFAREAKPNDILFVYLAGHGITINLGSDTYYYLTQEATTTNKETLSKDSELLSSSTINSEELTQWHKGVKAQKQVLILDTCAAGAIGNEFKIAEKRELSSDAIRAIDNMRGRVGFHVLMGSAADAVSYEASQYGQGLLTYSLLQGIKGAALQSDGQIDVSALFNYAANTVPILAKNIGGIQKPEIKIPEGGTSFALGLIKTDEDRKLIPLALVKPVILRPNFQNQDEFDDNLRIGNLLRDRLREASYAVVRGDAHSGLVFVEADEMPDAFRPVGRYLVEADLVRVTFKLIRNNNALSTITIEGSKNDLHALTEKIYNAINLEAQKLNAMQAANP